MRLGAGISRLCPQFGPIEAFMINAMSRLENAFKEPLAQIQRRLRGRSQDE